MAWKRGTQNNLPGEIRKGHIKEFLFPSLKKASVSYHLRIFELPDCEERRHSATALVSSKIPECFVPFLVDGTLFIHSHDHPRSVLKVFLNDDIPEGHIALNEIQRINSKVCIGELQEWTIYQGDTFAYDARSGAIGDTEIRLSTQPPRLLQRVVMTVRPRHTGSMGLVDADRKGNRIDEKSFIGSSNNNEGSGEQKEISCTKINVDTRQIIRQLSTSLSDCIVSSEDIYTTQYTTQHGSTEIVVRIADLLSMTVVREIDENYDEEEEEYEILETRRGIVGLETDFFLVLENSLVPITLLHSHAVPTVQPHKDLIHVYTRDEEYFPVLRRLLRPCIALTSSVQMGRGIYGKDVEDNNNRFNSHQTTDMNNLLTCSARDVPKSDVQINVDACTFDKVLLFLEHEARGEKFKFDPLLATELRDAAVTLGVTGLTDLCDKVLGSFQERVRRSPIRLSEVIARNKAGTECGQTSGSKRGETLLLLDGMVLDISRWIEEHPGGSSIIPEQALNKDSTVFFEIYHASSQSFLYLKEFYIGELAEEDRSMVPSSTEDGVAASPAFLEQLKKLSKWRLTPSDMILYKSQKSF